MTTTTAPRATPRWPASRPFSMYSSFLASLRRGSLLTFSW